MWLANWGVYQAFGADLCARKDYRHQHFRGADCGCTRAGHRLYLQGNGRDQTGFSRQPLDVSAAREASAPQLFRRQKDASASLPRLRPLQRQPSDHPRNFSGDSRSHSVTTIHARRVAMAFRKRATSSRDRLTGSGSDRRASGICAAASGHPQRRAVKKPQCAHDLIDGLRFKAA